FLQEIGGFHGAHELVANCACGPLHIRRPLLTWLRATSVCFMPPHLTSSVRETELKLSPTQPKPAARALSSAFRNVPTGQEYSFPRSVAVASTLAGRSSRI